MADYATQQKHVLNAVMENASRPLTAREILAEAQKEMPGMGISTVYRALKRMLHDAEVHVVELPGMTPHYEVWGKHHHFFFCRKCHRIFNLMGCVPGVDKLAPKRFRVQGHEIVLYGTCAECA